jgi:nitrogen-specific signal transduction histidine kinase
MRHSKASRAKKSKAAEASHDFGEMLRHEVNNPLTGILGNAELLLARRERLTARDIERLETIAELAVRLRETIRRLSYRLQNTHQEFSPLTLQQLRRAKKAGVAR